MNKPDFQEEVLLEEKTKVQKPNQYKVLLHNDDYTPMDFVVEILQKYFSMNKEKAVKVMLAVHHTGVGVCGIYPKEIAETKVHQVIQCARNNQHPLKCTMERA